jgi:hypothetical protein
LWDNSKGSWKAGEFAQLVLQDGKPAFAMVYGSFEMTANAFNAAQLLAFLLESLARLV